MKTVIVIGAGPAGLMAADVLSAAGVAVTIVDAMPSAARKFLMAGKSGLNLTKQTPDFMAAYGDMPDALKMALAEFGPEQVIDWAQGLGQDIFTGSTGRVFPKVMKASPLLRAWLARLSDQGVHLKTKTRWIGWEQDGLRFETPDGPVTMTADATVLALGGASWARLGSDGSWADFIGTDISPFQPANMGFNVDWSPHMQRHFGQPIKGVQLRAGPHSTRGEFVISQRGIEGGGIYEISAFVRDGAALRVDLLPDMDIETVRAKWARRGKASTSSFLRKAFRLDAAKIALFQEFGRSASDDVPAVLKSLPIHHSGPRPIDEAISVAGGVKFDTLTDEFMLRSKPGVFCAGEMLDWEAPTGGYLITGCLATGRSAAMAALAYLAGKGA